jgi:hypothetical protein
MYRLIIALSIFATMAQALPTNTTVRMATEGYVTNKVAAGVASAVAQAGTNVTIALEPYYPRNNPSNYITLAEVPAQTQQVYVATAGTAGTVTGSQSNLIASALQAEADPTVIGAVSNHNGSATAHTNLLDLAGTRPMTGNSVTLARDVKSRDAISVGLYGTALGGNTTAGMAGAAFGFGTTAGDEAAAFGEGTRALQWGAAFGLDSIAAEYALAIGQAAEAGILGASIGYRGKAGPGSFVFSSFQDAVSFDRSTKTNWFSVRASGGTYFETPSFEAAALKMTNSTVSGRGQTIITPTNNANLFRVDVEPGANVTGIMFGRPGSVVPPGANGSYLCYIKAPASGTYNHALGLEAGKSNGEILHLYNKDQKHVARFNTDSSEELEVRWSRPDGQDQLYYKGGTDPYMTIGTGGLARAGSARLTVGGSVSATSVSMTEQIWSATGTNATYRMSWDVSNMTWKVEEILP